MKNWAGSYSYRARVLHRPTHLEALQELVARAPRIRAVGTRHSFSGIGDTAELLTLEGLPAAIELDSETPSVRVTGATRYGELATALEARGWALHNLASLPHISVAGAVATATHGSGDNNGNLATAVTELELVTSDGELLRARRGDAGFEGMVVNLGALGVMTRVTLEVEPTYRVRQVVYEGLAWDALLANFEAIMSAGYSVSAFMRWGDEVDQVWLKLRDGQDAPGELFGAVAAGGERHPIAGMDPANCTRQQGVEGPWFDRLPHFRMGFTPSSGAEIQSEFIVPRDRAAAAIEALRSVADVLRPLTQVSELRTVAADRLWLSPQYERDSFAIHFTWVPDHARVEHAVGVIEQALAPLQPRPHWGKLFTRRPAGYPRLGEFIRLAERLDPRGAFRNEWLERNVL